MSEYLDYKGLKYYHKHLNKKLQDIKDEIDFMNEKSDLVAKGLAKVDITVHYQDGAPLEGVNINTLYDSDGNSVSAQTNSSGFISGYIPSGSKTISTASYADISNATNTQTYVAGNRYKLNFIVNRVDYLLITSTQNIMFSNDVESIDYSLVGGGGGGSSAMLVLSSTDKITEGSHQYAGGSGGGGGYVTVGTLSNIIPDTNYQITIGSGGSGGAAMSGGSGSLPASTWYGKDGGGTTAFGVTANGGKGGTPPRGSMASVIQSVGGTGNGTGGKGAVCYVYTSLITKSATSGGAGTQSYYSSFTESALCGGGGGGGGACESSRSSSLNYISGMNGGSPYGGNGGTITADSSNYVSWTNPTAGSPYGGGGAGGSSSGVGIQSNSSYFPSGGTSGGKGVVAIRIHHKQ